MPPDRVLILGGTSQSRDLTAALQAEGFDTITSLAGVTETPVLPSGPVRRGGFGGTAGLVAFLGAENISAIADATHPFAAQMSAQAFVAAEAAEIPYVRLELPPWVPQSDDLWTSVRSMEEATSVIPAGARVLAAVGRKEIQVLFGKTGLGGVARMIEPTGSTVPAGWHMMLARPPYTIEAERVLLRDYRITHLISKNSGNPASAAKLLAAREAGVRVVMIERPGKPTATVTAEVSTCVRLLRDALLP
jgi:precorrin-6A/cobalt-precorrin-6A reductase